MTKLELAICEAEHYGDIDIDTRDTMLDIINEKTAMVKHMEKRKIKADRYEKILNDYVEKLQKKYGDNYHFQWTNREGEYYYKLKDMLRSAKDVRDRNAEDAYDAYVAGKKGNKKKGECLNSANIYRGQSERQPETKGRYKTTNGLKESVDDLIDRIYESELSGNITIEEREELLDYLEYNLSE